MIGLIANKRAGSVTRYERTIEDAIHRVDGIVRRPRTFTELDDAVHEFKENGVRMIATLGGDGTNHQVISRAQEAQLDIPLAPLGKGTQNLMRRYLRAPDRCPVQQLDDILNNRARRSKKRLLRIDADGHTRYGFLFGIGVAHKFMQRYYDEGARRLPTIAKTIASAVFGTEYATSITEPVHVRVSLNGEPEEVRAYTALLAGTIRNVDAHHAPLYLADRRHGLPHVITSTHAPTRIIREYFSILRGRPLRSAQHDTTFTHLDIEGDNMGYMIDGDLASEQPYIAQHITVRPGPHITFILPRH